MRGAALAAPLTSAQISCRVIHVVLTESGRTLNGVLAEKDARVVVLKTADGQKVAVPRTDVAEMTISGQSLMPENLLQGMTDQEVRDLSFQLVLYGSAARAGRVFARFGRSAPVL